MTLLFQWVERVRVWLQQNRAPIFDALRALDTDGSPIFLFFLILFFFPFVLVAILPVLAGESHQPLPPVADGYITVEQATAGLTKLRAPMSEEEMETYVQALDLDGTKTIHYCSASTFTKTILY